MKRVSLITAILTIVCAIALLVAGAAMSEPSAKMPQIEMPSLDTTPTEPMMQLNVPSGVYYYVMGTHTAYTGDESHLENPTDSLPFIQIDGTQYIYSAEGSAQGYAKSENEFIIFDNPEAIQNAMPINMQHDDLWHAIYYPKQELDWQCTYNAEAKTITIAHNSDFVQFMYFETIEEYAQYIRDNFMQDGTFEIYPTPHDIEGEASGVTPES